MLFSVYSYPVPGDKIAQSVIDGLHKEVELLGAVKSGFFCVDCEIYQSVSQSSVNGKRTKLYGDGAHPLLVLMVLVS